MQGGALYLVPLVHQLLGLANRGLAPTLSAPFLSTGGWGEVQGIIGWGEVQGIIAENVALIGSKK